MHYFNFLNNLFMHTSVLEHYIWLSNVPDTGTRNTGTETLWPSLNEPYFLVEEIDY